MSVSGLGRVARVSHDEKRISEDDLIWRERLIKDFRFPSDRAEDLKNQIKKNYKQTYQYCVEYKLNGYQQSALAELQDQGLTASHLRGRTWFCSTEHKDVLVHLIRKRNFDADKATLELDGLNWQQARGVSKGLMPVPLCYIFHNYFF